MRETHRAGRKGNTRWSRTATILLVVLLLVGLGLVLYPGISNWWNSRVQSRTVTEYNRAVRDLTEDEYADLFQAADLYNAELAGIGSATMLAHPDRLGGYWDTLDVTGTGLIGYVTIGKINVQMPIYHGTDPRILSAAAGHMQGSSLPVGGPGTHSVISAHRGLPSAKLFTNLDKLETGDTFTITVLNRVLTYEVDQISTVLPSEVESLYIDPDGDYCTLVTCTPYGINTHRLLVRGVRVENGEEIQVTPDASQVNSLLVAPFLAIPAAILLVLVLLLLLRRRSGRQKRHEA